MLPEAGARVKRKILYKISPLGVYGLKL